MPRVNSYQRRWKVQHYEAWEGYTPEPWRQPGWEYYASGFKTEAEAEELARKRAERTGGQYRVVEETKEEVASEAFEAQRDDAIDTAGAEALSDARGRCTVPPWAFDKCIEIQQSAVEEMRLEIMNDEDLYERGPYSSKYRPMVSQVVDWSKENADTAFKPDAEQELRRLEEVRISETDPERRRDQLAHEFADRLFAPYVEQFTEIPREERIAAVRETTKAVRGLLADYTTSLRANWPRRSR